MELSKEDCYEILELKPDASFSDAVRNYKYLALDWYPDKHNRSSVSLKKFQLISQAIVTFGNPDIPCRNLMTLEQMLSLFQFIFFGNDSLEEKEDEEEDDDSHTFDSDIDDEDDFEEFYNDWRCDNVELLKEAYKSLTAGKDALCQEKKPTACQTATTSAKEAVQNAEELIQEEEREKRKAKKRRAQKKRRKEKKKQEKNAQKKGTEGGKKEEKKEESEDDSDEEMEQETKAHQNLRGKSSSESEEEIDPESAFVAVIAKKKNKNIPLKKESDAKAKHIFEKENSLESQQEENSRILRSQQLALRGNQMANAGYYQEAVELFSEAIHLNTSDYRFFGNRSYCYEQLGNAEKALSDAERSIALEPKGPKGYFRKGKALVGLKRYAEAEKCFAEVLQMDRHCEDAVKELFFVKVFQIIEMGFSREEAEKAIEQHGSVSKALDHLLPAAASTLSLKTQDELFLSDDEDFLSRHTRPLASQTAVDPKMDPNNPEGHCSIWVGSLQPGVTKEIVTSLFSVYGEVSSIKFEPDKKYAFVNYKTKQAAGKAMRALQGAELLGAYLKIKYPNTKPSSAAAKPGSSQDSSKAKTFVLPVNGDECYFWRTLGCIHGSNCRYKHIKEHKGIDCKKVSSKF